MNGIFQQNSIVASSAALETPGQAHCTAEGNFHPTSNLHLDTKQVCVPQVYKCMLEHTHTLAGTQVLTHRHTHMQIDTKLANSITLQNPLKRGFGLI